VGRFFVRPEGLAFAAEALEGAACGASVVFVDEIGPWELQGGGLAPSLRDLLPRPLVLVLVVRAGLVEAVRQVFAIPEGRVWEVRSGSVPSTES
jgi:nucleoside-triphosphatase THEP1